MSPATPRTPRLRQETVGDWNVWSDIARPKPEFGPNRHGFDKFFGFLSGAVDYFTDKAPDAAGAAGGLPGGVPDLWENLAPIDRTGYLTDLLSDKAVEIIARPHAKPFFLSLQYKCPALTLGRPPRMHAQQSVKWPQLLSSSYGSCAGTGEGCSVGTARCLAIEVDCSILAVIVTFFEESGSIMRETRGVLEGKCALISASCLAVGSAVKIAVVRSEDVGVAIWTPPRLDARPGRPQRRCRLRVDRQRGPSRPGSLKPPIRFFDR